MKQAALVFQNLIKFEYDIVLGKKKKLICFTIRFREIDFFHLIGLQYLKDLPQLKKDREIIFNQILSGEISETTIAKSSFYPTIEERITDFLFFENILDSENTVFKYCYSKSHFSNIRAEFLLQTSYDKRTNYIFIDFIDTDFKYCKSFFFNDTSDYTYNQIRTALLRKVKRNTQTNESIIIIDKLKTDDEQNILS